MSLGGGYSYGAFCMPRFIQLSRIRYISGIALHWYDGYFFDNVRTFQEKYGSQYYQLATEGCEQQAHHPKS